MDTSGIMPQIECGPTTSSEAYLQQPEAREHREMFLRMYEKPLTQYELTPSTSDYHTEDKSSDGESGSKRPRPKQEVEQTNKRRKYMPLMEMFGEDGDTDCLAQAYTYGIMVPIAGGPTTSLEAYLQQPEVRERREMFLRKYSTSGYDTDGESSDGEPDYERSCPNQEVEQPNKRRKYMRFSEELSSEEENGGSDYQAQTSKRLIIQKVWSLNENYPINQLKLEKRTSILNATAENSEPEIIDLCTPSKENRDSPKNRILTSSESEPEMIDLCTPPQNKARVAPCKMTFLSSEPRDAIRRLNFHNLDDC